MSNWDYLNRCRLKLGPFRSDPSYGFNGMFLCRVTERQVPVKIIASDGLWWRHVSVTQEGSSKTPSWEMMCAVKDLFWDEEDWVVQYHPAKSKAVNNHPSCLHLWQPLRETLPTPEPIMVGVKEWGELK